MKTYPTPISPLRHAMITCMQDQDLAPSTIKTYTHWVTQLSQHYQRCPSRISTAHMNAFLLHLIRERKLAWSTVNQALCSLRYFLAHIMKQDEPDLHIPPRKKPQRLPEVLTQPEARKVVQAHPRLKYRTALHLLYGSGLRLSECARLKIRDIDSQQMQVRVEQGKGRKDRYTLLPQTTLLMLRSYYTKEHDRHSEWLFPGKNPDNYISPTAFQRAYHEAKQIVGIFKTGGVHTLRHCFASHHLQLGTDLPTLQRMLGHTDMKTTMRYLQVVVDPQRKIRNPLDDAPEA